VLTKKQKENFDICNEYLANPRSTLEQLATKMQVSRRTVTRAIEWGQQQGFFISDSAEKIKKNIIDIQSTLEVLETEYQEVWKEQKRRRREQKRLNREAKKNGKTPENITFGLARTLSMLSKRILEYKTRIMELEGLYSKLFGKVTSPGGISSPITQMLNIITGPIQIIEGNEKNGNNGTNGENNTNKTGSTSGV